MRAGEVLKQIVSRLLSLAEELKKSSPPQTTTGRDGGADVTGGAAGDWSAPVQALCPSTSRAIGRPRTSPSRSHRGSSRFHSAALGLSTHSLPDPQGTLCGASPGLRQGGRTVPTARGDRRASSAAQDPRGSFTNISDSSHAPRLAPLPTPHGPTLCPFSSCHPSPSSVAGVLVAETPSEPVTQSRVWEGSVTPATTDVCSPSRKHARPRPLRSRGPAVDQLRPSPTPRRPGRRGPTPRDRVPDPTRQAFGSGPRPAKPAPTPPLLRVSSEVERGRRGRVSSS